MSNNTRPSSKIPPRTPSDCAIRSVLASASPMCGMVFSLIRPIQSPLTLSIMLMFSGSSVIRHSSPTPQNERSGSEISSWRKAKISSRRLYSFCCIRFLTSYLPVPSLARITSAISKPMLCTLGLRMSRINSRIASFCIPVIGTEARVALRSGAPLFRPALMLRKLSTTIGFTSVQSKFTETALATSTRVAVATSWTSGFTTNSSAGHAFRSA
mmetsp:Transcript_14454/g.41210  ORF Transcript_14454/g.41210 Transcript_14454/m.41210 type:complete len:213 (+) Transcript_14454:446-1084(+)